MQFSLRYFLIVLCVFLQSCASSDVSREAAGNFDAGYQNTASSYENLNKSNLGDTYANASQASKGVLIGGAAGAVTGGLTNGVGVVPGLAIGAILGGAYGAYIDSHTSLRDQIENRGVKIITLGDQILIVIPSKDLFYSMTPTIRVGAYSTLDLVAQYINQYTSMLVKVASYTNASGSSSLNRSLSKDQAGSVVRYLWTRVNTRLLTAVGMGGRNLIAKDQCELDQGENYRVEITLEKLEV